MPAIEHNHEQHLQETITRFTAPASAVRLGSAEAYWTWPFPWSRPPMPAFDVMDLFSPEEAEQ